MLFTGSLRFNLTPFGEHSDAECWAALRRAHLADMIEGTGQGLDLVLTEGGAPLSAGQKQLVALARALLRHSKVSDQVLSILGLVTGPHGSVIALCTYLQTVTQSCAAYPVWAEACRERIFVLAFDSLAPISAAMVQPQKSAKSSARQHNVLCTWWAVALCAKIP